MIAMGFEKRFPSSKSAGFKYSLINSSTRQLINLYKSFQPIEFTFKNTENPYDIRPQAQRFNIFRFFDDLFFISRYTIEQRIDCNH